MNRECNSKRNCPEDSDPLTDFNSGDPEREIVFATQTQNFMPPPLGSNFVTSNCYNIGQGETQEEAAGNALSSVVDCIASHGLTPPTQILPDPPGTPPENRDPNVFQNSDQLCTALCSDGLPFTFVVQAGRFTAFSQREADTMAHTYACNQVLGARVCVGTISPPECCLGQPFSTTITATKPATFSVFSGSLPTGLRITTLNATTGLISGTPTATGQFQFSLRATDANGDYMQKTFVMITVGVITSSLPSVQALVPYSTTLVGSTVSFGTMVWSIVGGALPPGLTFNPANQTISGTPTTGGTYSFTVQMADGIVQCRRTLSIVVFPCIAFNPGTSAIHWYDASQLNFVNGSQPGTWPDMIPVFGVLFGGPASPNFPLYLTGIINGKPVFRWTGAVPNNQAYRARNASNTVDAVDFCNGLTCMDWFCVGRQNSGGSGGTMTNNTLALPGSGGFRMFFKGSAVPVNQFQVDFKRTNASITQITKKAAFIPTNGDFNIYHVKLFWNNSTISVNINGTNYLNADPTGETPGAYEHNTTSWMADSGAGLDADIAEEIYFSNNLDQATIDKVFGYLAFKYALQSKLPADHPYKNSVPCA